MKTSLKYSCQVIQRNSRLLLRCSRETVYGDVATGIDNSVDSHVLIWRPCTGHPEQVIPLDGMGEEGPTGSGAHRLLRHFGAVVVGTPSSQAPNAFGSTTGWTLKYTRIEGQVPVIVTIHFPEDPENAHALPVDCPLTYDRLASYGFDPNAAYLCALELF